MVAALLIGLCLAQGRSSAQTSALAAEPPAGDLLVLSPGQIRTLEAPSVQRVAVGDPGVVDVTIVSSSQILVQARAPGTTNVLLWDAGGQRELLVNVVDPTPSAVAEQLPEVLGQLNVPGVGVRIQGGKVFLVGEVLSEEQLQSVEQLAQAYQGTAVSLVTVRPAVPPPVGPVPMVKLSMQVVEINRTDLEKLGVSWSSSVAFTEPAVENITWHEALMRFGTSINRASFGATLNALVQKNRARVLSEPNLVTASGKEASSFIGVEVPTIQATSFGTETSSVGASIQFRQTGVLLKITPQVTGEDEQRITTNIQAEVSGVDTSVGLSVPVGSKTILVPGFKVRKASTEVTTASGETIVIAGLLEAEDTSDMTQVPALGSIPVLGRLFRNPEKKATRRELVIAVTPELVAEAGKTAERGLAVEQALAVAEVTASVDEPRLRYALQVQERIAKALRYPSREKESGIGGTVKLRLHLFADGTLGQAMVAESSGIEALDLEALKAAETAAPYPPFPNQLAERELRLEVPIIFRP